MKRLPIGIQNFKEIACGDYVYIDKTRYVYDLINGDKFNFLSRPRRFGKSLLLDTIAEVMRGERELFKGLWIYESDYGFQKHPVVRLDMSSVSTKNPDELGRSIISDLRRQVLDEKLDIDTDIPSDMFKQLIERLSRKYDKQVVVLIDEYDKPILDHITNFEMADANRQVIKGFYGILKSMDPHLRFVMMTGVSKFTKTSVFSELNNMVDITMMEKYANICGITVEDFDTHFSEHIDSLSSKESLKYYGSVRDGILKWYDGYSWDGKTRVLNPFSLLCFFSHEQFSGFWYSSGTPAFLVKMIAKKPEAYANVHDYKITADMLDSGDINKIPFGPLMFQSGYLTVKEVSFDSAPPVYTLEMPNLEVKDAFNRHVLSYLADKDEVETRSMSVDLRNALKAGDLDKALAALRRLFSSIPYQLHVSNEAYYHSIIYALMSFTGLETAAEVSVADGRVDAVVEYDDKVYVMEFKYGACKPEAGDNEKKRLFDGLLEDGMRQIEERGCYKKYAGSGQAIYKVAFAFLGRSDIEMKYERVP